MIGAGFGYVIHRLECFVSARFSRSLGFQPFQTGNVAEITTAQSSWSAGFLQSASGCHMPVAINTAWLRISSSATFFTFRVDAPSTYIWHRAPTKAGSLRW